MENGKNSLFILLISFITFLFMYLKIFQVSFMELVVANKNAIFIFFITAITILFLEYFLSIYLPPNFLYVRVITYFLCFFLVIAILNILQYLNIMITPFGYLLLINISFIIAYFGSQYIKISRNLWGVIASFFGMSIVFLFYLFTKL